MEKQITLTIEPTYSESRLTIKYFLAFLIWPFGFMLAALRHRDRKWSMNIFWLFCIFFGLTFTFSSEWPDSARYISTLKEFHQKGLSLSGIIDIINLSGSKFIDVAHPLITWFVSLFTDNPSVLLAFFGLIFGFFYSRNLWYLFTRIDYKITLASFLFLLTFALINPIWNINGFRMYTASQVFVYGLLPYLVEGKKVKLWWSAGSVLFHFAFIFPVAILTTYALLKNRLVFYFIFFIVTSFLNTINLEAVRDFLGFLPDFFDPRVETYTNPYYAHSLSIARETLNWYVPVSEEVLTFTSYVFAIVIFILYRKTLEGSFLNLFCFGIWYYGWANLASLVPSGGRFVSIANLIMIFFILLYVQVNCHQKYLRVLRALSIPGLVLFIVVAIRIGFDYMSFSTIIGNPVLSLFLHDAIPLITYVKELF